MANEAKISCSVHAEAENSEVEGRRGDRNEFAERNTPIPPYYTPVPAPWRVRYRIGITGSVVNPGPFF